MKYICWQILWGITGLMFFAGCSKSKVTDAPSPQLLSVCETTWGQIVTEGSKVIGYSSDIAHCGQDCNSLEYTCQNGSLIQTGGTTPTSPVANVYPNCTKETACSCALPSPSTQVSSGVALTFYKSATVACGSSCDAQKVDGLCSNGAFVLASDKISPVGNVSLGCSALACAPCVVPWDSTASVLSGNSITGYVSATAACGGTCDDAPNTGKILCTNGTWTSASGQPLASLKVGACLPNTHCNCTTDDRQTFNHSTAATFQLFSKTTGVCGNACGTGTTAKCVNGQFVDSSNHALANPLDYACHDTCVYCKLPKTSNLITAGSSATYSTSATVPCGQNCQTASLVCGSDGNLTVAGGGNVSDYTETSCKPLICQDCAVPWSLTERLGNTLQATRYRSANADCSHSCKGQSVTVSCNNSALQVISGDATIPLAQSTNGCTDATCAACSFGGGTYPNGTSVVAYKQNLVACNASCGDTGNFTTLTCDNSKMLGDAGYNYNSCNSQCAPTTPPDTRTGDNSPESGGASAGLCPVLASRSFAFGSTQLSYYTQSSTACGDSCENYRKVYQCDPTTGLMSGPVVPVYLSCKESCP